LASSRIFLSGPDLHIYTPPPPPRDRVAQLYSQTLGRSRTSGSPFPVPTYVGPWGDQSPKLDKILCYLNPLHIITISFTGSHFNGILLFPSHSSKLPLPIGFLIKILYECLTPRILHI
jgi:hypothetical protein